MHRTAGVVAASLLLVLALVPAPALARPGGLDPSFSRDGTERTVHGYRAVRYEIPPGCAAGYMPELNVLCGIADVSTQSEQPVTKHLVVEVTPSRETGPVD